MNPNAYAMLEIVATEESGGSRRIVWGCVRRTLSLHRGRKAFSPYAGVAAEQSQHQKLERLFSYISNPAVATTKTAAATCRQHAA